jgi:hypothetical protein
MQKTIYVAVAASLLVWSQVNAATTYSVSQEESQFGEQGQFAPLFSTLQHDWLNSGVHEKWRGLLNTQLSESERWAHLEGVRDQYLDSHDWPGNGELWNPGLCMGDAAGCDFTGRLNELITHLQASPYYDGRFDDFLKDGWLQDKHEHWRKPGGVVPLPPAIALFASALLGLGWLQRRRNIKNSIPA